jgi:phosphatidylglycerol:prolipoprotein diacylglycerol transferase
MRQRFVDYVVGAFGIEFSGYLIPTPVIIQIIAIIVVSIVFVKRSNQAALSKYHALGICLWAIIGGMIGARLFFLIYNIKTTILNPGQIFDLGGATVSWGGYLGGLFGFIFYSRLHKIKFLPYADALTSCLALGPFIGRWSCLLNGCCYGKLSDKLWAVSYPEDSIPYIDQVHAGIIENGALLSLAVHPLPIYHSLAGLFLFVIMTFYWKRYRNLVGLTFFMYWILYALSRYFLDYLRGDSTYTIAGPLSLTQVIAVLFIFVSGAGLFFSIRYRRTEI